MLPGLAGIIASSAIGYTPNKTNYDGSTNWLNRGAALTGAADGSQGIFFGCITLNGGDASTQIIMTGATGFVTIARGATNKFSVQVSDSGAKTLLAPSLTSYTASATRHTLLMAWDTNFSAGNKILQMYIDDINDIGSITDASTAFNVQYTTSDVGIGATSGGLLKTTACMSDVYLCSTTTLDLSVTANRRKFVNATNKPVNLLTSGAPTGIIYQKNPAASVGTNSGTGGNFTTNGSFSAC